MGRLKSPLECFRAQAAMMMTSKKRLDTNTKETKKSKRSTCCNMALQVLHQTTNRP